MSLLGNNARRRIIPRWRDFRSTAKLGELRDVSADNTAIGHPPIAKHATYSDWKREPHLWNALDLIGSAIIFDETEEVSDAILQVLLDPATPSLARKLLGDQGRGEEREIRLPSEPTTIGVGDAIRREIARIKRELASFPWDAINWIELARNYTTLGVHYKANRAILIALQLAPGNRYALRSAARFYMHRGDPERAQNILFRRANIVHDPWLLAAEIAVTSAMGKTSKLAKVGRSIVQGDIAPGEITELASALGTLEAESGNNKGAKRMLRRALEGANENSVAQIEWLNRQRLGELIDISAAKPPLLHEASAWGAFTKGEWHESLHHAWHWLRDQPFSTSPAMLCSYLLSDILETHEEAARVCRMALLANPNEPMLQNNYAFALINSGRLAEAKAILDRIDFDSLRGLQRMALATLGLLEFRQGSPELGRQHYVAAISEAKKENDKIRAARAAIYLAKEEVRARTKEAPSAVLRALDVSKNVESPDVGWQFGQLEKLVRSIHEEGGSPTPR
jgi:tetratricopeptide (TPR) repeat protein